MSNTIHGTEKGLIQQRNRRIRGHCLVLAKLDVFPGIGEMFAPPACTQKVNKGNWNGRWGRVENKPHPFMNEPTKAPGMKESSQGPMLTVSMIS